MVEQLRRSAAPWVCMGMLLLATAACTRPEVEREETAAPDPDLVEQVRTDLDTLGEE